MAENVTSYIVENDQAFSRAVDRLRKATNDFRVPFGLIAKDFYRSNKKIFQLQGPGLYPDFKTLRSAQQKVAAVGFEYPLLLRTGRLASSLLNPGDGEAIRNISKTGMQLGSTVPYLKFHQSDRPRTKLPQRKALFIDGGPFERSRGGKSGRRFRWLNILNTYTLDVIKEMEFNDV